jgi:hypothetical protein
LKKYSSVPAGIFITGEYSYILYILTAKEKPVLTVYFQKMGECREVLGGGPAPPSKL